MSNFTEAGKVSRASAGGADRSTRAQKENLSALIDSQIKRSSAVTSISRLQSRNIHQLPEKIWVISATAPDRQVNAPDVADVVERIRLEHYEIRPLSRRYSAPVHDTKGLGGHNCRRTESFERF